MPAADPTRLRNPKYALAALEERRAMEKLGAPATPSTSVHELWFCERCRDWTGGPLACVTGKCRACGSARPGSVRPLPLA